MCFSAPASFTSSGVLAIIGLFTLKAAKDKSHLLLACVPLLFALQQFSEGMVWLSLQHEMINEHILGTFKLLYLIFAFVIWPTWIPLSLLLAEKMRVRRVLLSVLLLLGLMLSLMCVSYYPDNTFIAKIVNRKIEYSMAHSFEINLWLVIGWYTAVVILPTLISSLELIWLFGLGLLFSWIVSEYYSHDNFTSVWCFFSALLSIILYAVIKINNRQVKNA